MLYFYKDNNFTHDFAAFEIQWPYRIKKKTEVSTEKLRFL